MKSYITRIVSSMLVLVLLFLTMAPSFAYAQRTDESDTVTPPKGYVPNNTYLNTQTFGLPRTRSANQNTPKVLLIEDVNPWNSVANQTVLSGITQYDKVTTSEFLNVNLEEYGVVVFANDQPFSTYDNYSDFKEYLEVFASIGGVIVFGACDAGWSNGELIEKLPGNVTKKTHYEENNYVANSNHAIIGGSLTEGTVLQSSDLVSRYCSHVSFDEASLPAGSTVILRESSTNRPTLVEYPLGKGRVIASGLTWEHNYVHGGSTISGVKTGRFAQIAMADMFQYAIRVSSIEVDEIHQLDDWKMERAVHGITVVAAGSDMTNLQPIVGAEVKISGGKTDKTDKNGQVFIYEYGEKEVTVTANGYRAQTLRYDLEQGKNQFFFLVKVSDQKPYFIQIEGATDGKKTVDLRSQSLHFKQDDASSKLKLTVRGDWSGHQSGSIILYQGSSPQSATRKVTLTNGTAYEFTPGTVFEQNKQIKVQMVASDGTASEPVNVNILIDKPIEAAFGNQQFATEEGVSYIDFFGTHKVESQHDVIKKLLQFDFSLKSDLIPIEFTRDVGVDGSVTITGIVGFAKGEGTKNIKNMKLKEESFEVGSAWDEFKKQIKGYKKAGDPKAYFANLKKKYGKDWHATKLRMSHETQLDVVGFLEYKFDKNGNLINHDGGMIVSGAYDFVTGRTFMAGPVPVYFELKLGAGVDIKAALGMEKDNSGNWIFKNASSLTITLPKVALEGGVGVRGVATVGLQGNGDVKMKFPGATSTTSGELGLGGAIHAKVIFVVDYKWEFWNTTIQLWPTEKSRARLMALNGGAQKTLASREYLSYETEWNPYPMALMARSQSNDVFTTLQEGVMPDAMPQLHKVGDKLVMLFLQDVSSRSIGNHTQLVYSVYDNNVWSEPKAIWEGSTADFFFDSIVVDDQLYVAWQKSNKAQSATDPDELLKQVAESSEIGFAVWNNTSKNFEKQQYITSDSTFDMMPTLAANGKNISIVWVSSNTNDVVSDGATYVINKVDYKRGNFTKRQQLHSTAMYLNEIAAGYAGGDLEVFFIATDAAGIDGVYSVTNGQVKEIFEGNAAGLDYETGSFLWHDEGKLYNFNPNTQKLTAYQSKNNSASSSFKYISNETDRAIVWINSGETNSIMAAVRDNGQWSEPVVLLGGLEDNITFHDAAMLEDGRYAFVMNTANYDQGGLSNTSLKFAIVGPKQDTQLVSAVVNTPDWNTQKQELVIGLKNNGTEAVDEVKVKVADSSKVYFEQQIRTDLMPGEEKTISAMIDTSTIASVFDVTVSATPADDDVPDNNEATITLGCVDTKFIIDPYERNDQIMFQISVVNNSNTISHSALSIIEDSEDGIVIDMKDIGSVDNKQSIHYTYTVDKSKIDFVDGAKTYFFRLDSLEEDWSPENNVLTYTVSEAPDQTFQEPLTIMQQPVDQFVVVGQQAAFEISATGENVTYQWYINRNKGNGWRKIDGAISSSYTTSITDLECDGFKYYCKVSDQYGNTLNSDEAVLHVATAPVLPETGDSSTPVLWLAMSTLSMLGILLMRKKAYSK